MSMKDNTLFWDAKTHFGGRGECGGCGKVGCDTGTFGSVSPRVSPGIYMYRLDLRRFLVSQSLYHPESKELCRKCCQMVHTLTIPDTILWCLLLVYISRLADCLTSKMGFSFSSVILRSVGSNGGREVSSKLDFIKKTPDLSVSHPSWMILKI